MDEKILKAKIKGERARVVENIASRTELPKQQWWLSFADQDGFRGCVIVHASEFLEAVMETNLHHCNPHGQIQGYPIPADFIVPPKWTYRVLNRAEAQELDELLEPTLPDGGRQKSCK